MGRDASRKRGIDADDKAQGKKRERQESCDDGGSSVKASQRCSWLEQGERAHRHHGEPLAASGKGREKKREGERERGREEEEEEEEEGLFRANAVNEEDPERDRATQV